MGVMVKNKVARFFMDHGVYVKLSCLCTEMRFFDVNI